MLTSAKSVSACQGPAAPLAVAGGGGGGGLGSSSVPGTANPSQPAAAFLAGHSVLCWAGGAPSWHSSVTIVRRCRAHHTSNSNNSNNTRVVMSCSVACSLQCVIIDNIDLKQLGRSQAWMENPCLVNVIFCCWPRIRPGPGPALSHWLDIHRAVINEWPPSALCCKLRWVRAGVS